MAKEINIPKMYASEEIPCMLFDCVDDANEMDAAVREFTTNKDAIAEFDKAERHYASLAAVMYHIEVGDFHHNLEGDYSDKLIAAAENMIDIFGEDIDPSDCYTPAMNYIFHSLHPKVVKDL